MVTTAEKFDVVIIGGGPGGYAAALYGAAAGLAVALVEKDKVGGTCLHRGCIPAKELLETAHVFRSIGESDAFGISAGTPTIDFSAAQARKQAIIDQLTRGLSGVLQQRKVTMFDGFGSLGPDRTVAVSNGDEKTVLQGDHVVLASGSVPRTLPGFDVDGKFVLTSDEVFQLEKLPKSAVVIGGGAIGCEFASMMADLGTEVTILEFLPQILTGVDKDCVRVVEQSFKKRKIAVHTGVEAHGHKPINGTTTTVSFGDGDEIKTEAIVLSVGRRPFSDDLVLEGTPGVEIDDRGFVQVDEYCRTGADGVFAVGDLIATPGLAHVGFAEAILVIKQILGETAVPVDYPNVPWCVYCRPEVAFAGLTEQAATDAGFDVVTSKHRFAGNGRAMIVGDTEGLVKVIAEKQADGTGGRILGVHMAGPWVTEQLGQAYLAVNWEATVQEVAQFIQPHPTMSEMFGETVLSLTGRSLHG